MKQSRAARTYASLIEAAATEFDSNGYEGTSLARVCERAGISIGALTFHFSNKADLADKVQASGNAVTQAGMDLVTVRSDQPLQAVVDLTLALAGLLERETVVRAAARLARERKGATASWSAVWTPRVRELLTRAAAKDLESDTDPAAVAALAARLVMGVEVCVRDSDSPQCGGNAEVQLAKMWLLILRGISASPDSISR